MKIDIVTVLVDPDSYECFYWSRRIWLWSQKNGEDMFDFSSFIQNSLNFHSLSEQKYFPPIFVQWQTKGNNIRSNSIKIFANKICYKIRCFQQNASEFMWNPIITLLSISRWGESSHSFVRSSIFFWRLFFLFIFLL